MERLDATRLAALPEDQRAAVIAALTPQQAAGLLRDWRGFLARDKQLAPGTPGAAPALRGRPGLNDLIRAGNTPALEHSADWLIWLILAGRGFGKTRTGAEFAIEKARALPGSHGALVAPTTDDARKTMLSAGFEHIEGASGILAVSTPDFYPHYEPSKRTLTWPNGTKATIYSAEEPNRLRGPQHHWGWLDEIAAWLKEIEAFNQFLYGLRLGENPQGCITTTPRPIPWLVGSRTGEPLGALNDSTVMITRGSSYENRANLAPTYQRQVIGRFEGTRKGRQEIHAEVLVDTEGALWNVDLLDGLRVREAPTDWRRKVVAIDPQASAGTNATDQPLKPETGIVVAGLAMCDCRVRAGKDTLPELHFFLIEDCSGSFSPGTWGNVAVKAYELHDADRVIGEQNNGGAMVENTVRTAEGGRRAAYKAVHASQGKRTRAEPVVAFYEQGKAHHIGFFPLLEDQLCSWDPLRTGPSPNRLDALVWAGTELMLGSPESGADKLRRIYGNQGGDE